MRNLQSLKPADLRIFKDCVTVEMGNQFNLPNGKTACISLFQQGPSYSMQVLSGLMLWSDGVHVRTPRTPNSCSLTPCSCVIEECLLGLRIRTNQDELLYKRANLIWLTLCRMCALTMASTIGSVRLTEKMVWKVHNCSQSFISGSQQDAEGSTIGRSKILHSTWSLRFDQTTSPIWMSISSMQKHTT